MIAFLGINEDLWVSLPTDNNNQQKLYDYEENDFLPYGNDECADPIGTKCLWFHGEGWCGQRRVALELQGQGTADC